MEFKIYRGSWVRGGYKNKSKYGDSSLKNKDDRMCCLGQILCQAGVPSEKLFEIGYPEDINSSFLSIAINIGLAKEQGVETSLTRDCAQINDDGNITDKFRESRIKNEFELAGHTVKFVPGKAPWFNDNQTTV